MAKKKTIDITSILCKSIGMDLRQLTGFLEKGKKNYTAHKIRTKHKYRIVYQANDTLRKLQELAVETVFILYPVSKFSTAYEKGCSALKNAKTHAKARYLAHYDIKSFFQNIKMSHVQNLLQNDYDQREIELLWRICSLDGCLPMGACSSPFICNRVMYSFDNTMGKLFSKLTYTRYADDLVFSSKKSFTEKLEDFVQQELLKMDLELNSKKSYYYSEKSPKKVTGVIINCDNTLSVGKRYKKKVKKILYEYGKKGGRVYSKHEVLGHLNYIKFIEPKYHKKLIKKYRINV